MQKDEIVLQFFAEGGSIEIVKSYIADKPVFILSINERAFDESENKTSQKSYTTFGRAFASLNKIYPWCYLHLDFVKECYKEILRLKLVEHRQNSSLDEERYQYAGRRFLAGKISYSSKI
jgi:hypothetical protein